jgi:hypothetical protein
MSEAETSTVQDLIQAALDQNYNHANEVFGNLMGQKMTDALEQEKIAVANQIYNGGEPEEELDLDIDDEDLEVEDEEFDDDEEDLEDETQS